MNVLDSTGSIIAGYTTTIQAILGITSQSQEVEQQIGNLCYGVAESTRNSFIALAEVVIYMI